jgi:hypothetical protein
MFLASKPFFLSGRNYSTVDDQCSSAIVIERRNPKDRCHAVKPQKLEVFELPLRKRNKLLFNHRAGRTSSI